MSEKCIGCGIIKQNQNESELGYCRDLNQDYCQRCFRIMHYNDPLIDTRELVSFKEMHNYLDETDNLLIALVVDIMSVSSFLKSDYKQLIKRHPFVILINKIDLLPENANMEKVEANLLELIKEEGWLTADLKGIYLCHHRDKTFIDLFKDFLRENEYQKLIFMGSFNAGKTSLIRLLSDNKQLLNSYYPCTTLALQSVKDDEFEYLDSPGLIDEGNIMMRLDLNELKNLDFKKRIKAKIYQLYSAQSYFIADFLRLDAVSKRGSLVFYLPNNLDIKRVKQENAHRNEAILLKEQEYDIYEFKDCHNEDYEIAGLGFIAVRNIAQMMLKLPKGTRIIKRGNLL